jgi:UDP-N-acetylmuramoylalanine--D-glutamate ligase
LTVTAADQSMEPVWLNGEIAVVGLARSGTSAARLLGRAGARVYASDAGKSDELDATAAKLRREGVDVDIGSHDLDRIAKAGLVVASPGVPPGAPPFVAARKVGIEVVSEIEIGLRFLPGLSYVGITGTNGKTTTTALIAHLLTALGHDATAAGNIGTPLTEIAMRTVPPAWVALELSSFQLHDTPSVAPAVGVLTNLSANHLDRYSSAAEYYGDKALLFRNATTASRWVTNADDGAVQEMVASVVGEHSRFSVQTPADAYWDRASGELFVLGRPLMKRESLGLLGDHNVANALAASLAVMVAAEGHRSDRGRGIIANALGTFGALEHRIEPVGERDGVLWINDSKSTNVASTLVALESMTRPTVLLLGGRHKGEPYTSLVAALEKHARAVIAYGEAGELIQRDLEGKVPLTRLGSSFDEVVSTARDLAVPGDAVLLSPACSSYDMFENYEQRGATFKRLALGGLS